MGDVLGLGVTHGPLLIYPPEELPIIWPRSLTRPWVPEEMKDPANWSAPVRDEWGDDEGLQVALDHHARLVAGCQKAREALDAFQPDVVGIWGDDQYETFMRTWSPPSACTPRRKTGSRLSTSATILARPGTYTMRTPIGPS